MQKVVIIGASKNTERYSYKAMKMLTEYGHQVFLVTPAYKEIEGNKTYASLDEIATSVDTVTVYLSPQRQVALTDALLKLKPKRVIFNPGSENKKIYQALEEAGIDVLEACTLVLLTTQQF
jgi:hypothetical protein